MSERELGRHDAEHGVARLVSLSLRDFRNFARTDLQLPAEGLVIVGDNGQGKTNLLEAIHYLQILRSSRGARDQDLVRFGAEGFHIAAVVETDRRHEIAVGFERSGKRKRTRIDGVISERLSDALGSLPSVMFSPADVELIAGAPSARRRYLDIMLALSVRGYLVALQRYRAALARRNAALRDAARAGRSGEAAVSVWEPSLAADGAVIWRARRAWVDEVAPRLTALCHAIGEREEIRMRYASSISSSDDPEASLAAALAEKRGLDIKRGLTHAGPHRDDLALTIGGRELRTFGSAGQQRTPAIALRMLEAATLRESSGRAPLFLLDDPFAELDVNRATRILALLDEAGIGQTLLAVPRTTDIPRELTRLNRIRVASGGITPWSEE